MVILPPYTIDPTTVARAVLYLRTHSKLSQEDFASDLGVTTCQINRWENGHTQPNRQSRRLLGLWAASNNIDLPSILKERAPPTVYDKIEKLMTLARVTTNPHEAAAAMNRVVVLCTRFGISQDELDKYRSKEPS